MPEGTHSFHVARPPETVWRHLVDLERCPEWVPDLVSVEQLDPGEPAVGTRYRQVLSVMGSEVPAEVALTALEAPRTLAHEGEGGPARFATRFELEPDGEGTRVTQSWDVSLSGMLRAMSPMVAGVLQRNAETAAQAFRKLVEEG